MAAGVYFGYVKTFLSLKLHLFSLLFTYCLFRPQKHKVNQRFHVRDICFSAVAFMSRNVNKRNEIQTVLFSKQSGLPSWKHASRYVTEVTGSRDQTFNNLHSYGTTYKPEK